MTDKTIDYEQLIEDVGEWSTENFGDQPARYAAKGAIEELGELIHSDLKRDQSIRLDDKDVGEAAERDAVGDIMIYLADTLFRIDGSVELWGEPNHPGSKDVALSDVGAQASSVYQQCTIDDPRVFDCERMVKEIAANLRAFCNMKGYDFDKCVSDAWTGEVKRRDWDSEVTET